MPEKVTPDAVDDSVGVDPRTPLEPKTPLGAVTPSATDEGERIGCKAEERPKDSVGRTISGGFFEETPEAVVEATFEGGAWPRVVVTPLLTTTVLETMTVLTTPDATGALVSGAEPPVKTPRRSPMRSRFVEEREESSREFAVVFEISRFTCRGK